MGTAVSQLTEIFILHNSVAASYLAGNTEHDVLLSG